MLSPLAKHFLCRIVFNICVSAQRGRNIHLYNFKIAHYTCLHFVLFRFKEADEAWR